MCLCPKPHLGAKPRAAEEHLPEGHARQARKNLLGGHREADTPALPSLGSALGPECTKGSRAQPQHQRQVFNTARAMAIVTPQGPGACPELNKVRVGLSVQEAPAGGRRGWDAGWEGERGRGWEGGPEAMQTPQSTTSSLHRDTCKHQETSDDFTVLNE